MKEKERLQKNVMNLEAKVAALVVSVMQGVDERREGVIVGLKQEVHSLSMVLEMRSKELREEKEKRVTLEMELEEQTAKLNKESKENQRLSMERE